MSEMKIKKKKCRIRNNLLEQYIEKEFDKIVLNLMAFNLW